MKRRDVFRPGLEVDVIRPQPINPVYKPGEPSHSMLLKTTLEAFAPSGARQSTITSGASRYTLGSLLADPAFVAHLLANHTFIQGRMGFYESILSLMSDAAGSEISPIRPVTKQSQLPCEVDGKSESRIILTPIVDSYAALNKLVAEALWRVGIVWLVAPLASIQPHLLLNFTTLFLPPERPSLDALADVLPVDDVWTGRSFEHERVTMYLVTKYPPLITAQGSSGIAVAPLFEGP